MSKKIYVYIHTHTYRSLFVLLLWALQTLGVDLGGNRKREYYFGAGAQRSRRYFNRRIGNIKAWAPQLKDRGECLEPKSLVQNVRCEHITGIVFSVTFS